MKKAIDMLCEVKESIINAYEIKTGMGRGKISNLMDAESWMNAKKAVELGFADSIMFADDEKDDGTEIEAMMFSRAAVTNSFLSKFKIEKQPDNRIDAESLNKRLFLIAH